MELLARFIGIWMVYVIYIEVGVEGVAFGATCAVDADCIESNNVCTSLVCACSDASFLEDSSTTCTTKIALAGACTASPTGQCADSNAECHATDLICVCKANFFANKTAVCASQVAALDGHCDATDSALDQCAIPDSECRSEGTAKCLCKATHYTDGGACVIKKALAGACTASSTGQCADSNAECHATDLLCVCKAIFFVNKNTVCASQVGLTGNCDFTDTAVDQCSVTNTECRDDGAGGKCLCVTTHYSDETACQIKVAGLNTTCDGAVSATDQCSTTGTECKDDGTGTNRCLCKPTYYPDGSTCVVRSGVIKVTMLQYMFVVPFIVSMMTLLR